MIIRKYFLKCLSHASYLVADEDSREAVLIDPQRDLDQYLEDLSTDGWRLKYVIETHAHADFVSGHWDLAAITGAEVVFGAAAAAVPPHRKVRDGDVLRLGKNVSLGILETPGHTPDGICVLARDEAHPDEPGALFTGDTLFVGSVGRPDLLGTRAPAKALAAALYASLTRKLLPLPASTRVFPAHRAGSACGRGIGSAESTTLGEEKATNPFLRIRDENEFIDQVLKDLPSAPAYFPEDARMNLEGLPPLQAGLARLLPLDAGQVAAAKARGAWILDVRPADQSTAGGIPGALNIGLDGSFATWVGTLLPAKAEIVIVAPPGREREAALRCGRIGFDNVIGYLDGGIKAWTAAGGGLAGFPSAFPSEIPLFKAKGATLLDVRTEAEREEGSIPGSLAVPLDKLQRYLEESHPASPVLVFCAGGYRSGIAVSVVRRAGIGDVRDLQGGFAAYRAAGLPIEEHAHV